MSSPEERRDEERRARILLGILAPLVHRLNNSLAVVQGVYELGQQAREAEGELARLELAVLGQVLARVAGLARPPAARPIAFEEILRTHELLLGPLAANKGFELDLRADGAGAAEVDGRLERLLLAASTASLTAGERAPRARLSLVARSMPSGLVVVLGATGSAPPSADLAALQALARELGAGHRLRSTRGAWVLRLALATSAAAQVARAPGSAPRAGRVLFLHGADVERELVAELLREKGWSVVASAEEPHTGVFDLALIERRIALLDPSLPARVRTRFELERVEILDPRMRPGEVLRIVGG